MRIIHLALTPLVGAPQRICRALALHPEVDARFAVLQANVGLYDRMVFDLDLQWDRDRDEIIELTRTADVVHLHNFIDLDSRQFAPIDLRKLWNDGRPILRHFHSSPDAVAQQMGGTAQAAIDCPIPKLVIAQFHARYYPNARLVPNIVFADAVTAVRGDRLRIGYAPTRFNSARASRWDTKGYRETVKMLGRVVRQARARNIIVDIDLIEQVPHAECLQRKAACHIVIDDLVTGSYHLNTLEALAAGSVCLTHMDRATQQAVIDLTGRSDFPALSVGLEDAEAVLLDLVADPALIDAIGRRSREWMRRHWSPPDMARHFLDAYAEVIARPGQAFARRSESEPAVQEWLDIRLHDLVWANRHRRWPRVMPEWLRRLRGLAGGALRNTRLK